MRKLIAQFRRGKWVFFLCCKAAQKTPYFLFINKTAIFFCGKKFIQIKGEINNSSIPAKIDTLLRLVPDHFRKLICKQIQARQALIWVMSISLPVFFHFLFVSIGPVEYLILRKIASGNLFKRRAGQIQRMFAGDIVKSAPGFQRVNTFMGFVHNEQIKLQTIVFAHPFQFVVGSAKINGSFQPLQGFKGNQFARSSRISQRLCKFFTRQDAGAFLQRVIV